MIKKMSALFLVLLFSCSRPREDSHIYNGRLEAELVRLSAKIAGTIDSLAVHEGEKITKGQVLGKINSDRILAQKRQQIAQKKEINLSLERLDIQIRQIDPQFNLARETLEKTELLTQKGAATEHARDELKAKVDVLYAQMEGLQKEKALIANREEQLSAAIEITDLYLRDSNIVSPLNGLVINAYHKQAEVVNIGMVVFDVADLSQMEARIYVPLEDLVRVQIGQEASIHVDGAAEPFQGRVSWISSESEFTPKTILTEETRTTLVYAVKVLVSNTQGFLKIGMPVDVTL